MKCGWMDWSGADYTDSLDLKSLEELFGVQDKAKQEAPGAPLHACILTHDIMMKLQSRKRWRSKLCWIAIEVEI